MIFLPKKLKKKEINYLYKNIKTKHHFLYDDEGWSKFLQYFYDAYYDIDTLDKNEFLKIKNSAIHSHYDFFGVENILNVSSFHTSPLSKKFFDLKDKFPNDFDGFFDEWLENDLWENSCLHKELKFDHDHNLIKNFTIQILKNIHNLICIKDIDDLALVGIVDFHPKTGQLEPKQAKDISTKFYPFLLLYFDTIALCAHLYSHLDIFEKHHQYLYKEAEKINDSYLNNKIDALGIREFFHYSHADFFDNFLGYINYPGDDDKDYKNYQKELTKALNSIENFTRVCIVYSQFANANLQEDNLFEYKISKKDQSKFVKKVDRDLFSKINSIKCIDFEKVANYDYEKLLNFKFLKKLIKDYRNELDIRLLEYGQMTPHAIILGSK